MVVVERSKNGSIYRLKARVRAIISHDVFPEFSAVFRRYLYNPFGVLILAFLAALVCGLFLQRQALFLSAGVLAVLALGVAWPWLTVRALHGAVAFDRPRATEGERVQVCLTLRNRLPWSAWGLSVRDGFTDARTTGQSGHPVAGIASTPGLRIAVCRWALVPSCRGVYPLVVPRIGTGFPFGLWENQRQLVIENRLLVWPRTFPVGPVPLVDGDQQLEGNVSRNRVGSNGDVLGVRPYRRGDSPRRIHWGQSARHDRLIVCELQSNARPVVQLILDADPRAHAGTGPDGSREWAIRLVASLAKGWLEGGAQVGALWHDQEIPPASGGQQLRTVLDELARLPAAPPFGLAQLLASRVCRNFREGLQVIVTTDIALARMGHVNAEEDRQRWVVFRAEGFAGTSGTPASSRAELPVRPWLSIDAAEKIPSLLRGGWKEALHGS